ncbi:hypothetical protein GCM10023074_11800 [Microbispora amethystogenes]|uniref:Uncharacterized protein n=1 Tax=Microbispora amethystogenes TaxID=1427754 RepID=A0ABQ4FKL2_9ACTN|nr:hypothetical protein Mam01_55060 [Microbispora amethystogenes]
MGTHAARPSAKKSNCSRRCFSQESVYGRGFTSGYCGRLFMRGSRRIMSRQVYAIVIILVAGFRPYPRGEAMQ